MGIFLIQCTSDTAQQSCKAEETIIPVPHEACIQALPAQCCVTRVSAKRIGSRFPCPQTLKDPYWNSKITVPLSHICAHGPQLWGRNTLWLFHRLHGKLAGEAHSNGEGSLVNTDAQTAPQYYKYHFIFQGLVFTERSVITVGGINRSWKYWASPIGNAERDFGMSRNVSINYASIITQNQWLDGNKH